MGSVAGYAGELVGEFRAPRNMQYDMTDSIHADDVAAEMGFKAGLITGRVHMDQFVPQLFQVFGEDWLKRGTLSLFFTQATVHEEQVRTFVAPGEHRALVRMENEAAELICRGTATGTPTDEQSEFRRRLAEQAPAEKGELRILAGLAVGEEYKGIPVRIEHEGLDAALEVITEALPIYRERRVLPPSQVIKLSKAVEPFLLKNASASVGMYGALEVRNLRGPLYAGRDYVASTKLLKLAQSPRTEAAWWELTIADAATGSDVAAIGLLGRYMKASSPLWAEVS